MNLALFDLDGTLIPGDSDHGFGEFLAHLGWITDPAWLERNMAFFQDYQRGTLNLPEYVRYSTGAWRNKSVSELSQLQQRFVNEVVKAQIHPQALDLLQMHRQQGDLIAIVTATNEFVTTPIAQAFGVEHLLAVRLQRDEAGRYTGEIDGVPSFQAGKITRVHDWLQSLGHSWSDFEQTWFYSDSLNDLPLLEQASHPVATNPSARLRTVAQQRNWPILDLFTAVKAEANSLPQ